MSFAQTISSPSISAAPSSMPPNPASASPGPIAAAAPIGSQAITPQAISRRQDAIVAAHARPIGGGAKEALDGFAATLIVALLSPLFLVIALLVMLDGGPAFYSQRRVGYRGRHFGCLKFRSMVMDADARLAALLERDSAARAEWEESCKLTNDPRVTRIGRFLRKTSLDELPQLINVLRGEMSLVGPRPITQAELSRYGTGAEQYLAARPGITGRWQTSGRSDTSYDRRVQYDVEYVANWSLRTDVAILFATVPAVMLRRGAR